VIVTDEFEPARHVYDLQYDSRDATEAQLHRCCLCGQLRYSEWGTLPWFVPGGHQEPECPGR
jgi:hypothetical protein